MENKKLALLADDEPSVGSLAKNLLERLGYEVMWAPDGEEGVAMARAREPHIVVTDGYMPKADGYELAKALRSGYSGPIGLYTGRLQDFRDAYPDLDRYVDEVLEKPFYPKDFIAFVNRLESRASRDAPPA